MRAAGRLRPRSAGGRLVDSKLPSELPAAVIKTARRPETGEAATHWPGSHPRLEVPSDARSATRRSKCHPALKALPDAQSATRCSKRYPALKVPPDATSPDR